MDWVRKISRWITGIVFVFSGFVKGVDPLGTAYKIEDYFVAYGAEWANGLALGLSILLCAVEFTIGVALLLNLLPKITSRLLMLMMAFFTLLTFYDAIYDPVPDCGCFGDAISLTNWQTFYKNLVLMVFVFIIFFDKKNLKRRINKGLHYVAFSAVILIFIGFSLYNYRNLPLLDFRPWKIGNNMTADASDAEVHLTYRNIQTGETKDYISPNYPWNDSAWLANWEFVDQKFVREKPEISHNLHVEDEVGNDFTFYVLESDTMAVVAAYDLHAFSNAGRKHLLQLITMFETAHIPHLILTASLPEDVRNWQQAHHLFTEVFYADGIVLKTMIRSNPGLILFQRGVVVNKWHHNNFPDREEFGAYVNKTEQHP